MEDKVSRSQPVHQISGCFYQVMPLLFKNQKMEKNNAQSVFIKYLLANEAQQYEMINEVMVKILKLNEVDI